MTPRLPPRRLLESQISPKRTTKDFPIFKDTRFSLQSQPNGTIQKRMTTSKQRYEGGFGWRRSCQSIPIPHTDERELLKRGASGV
jgi:hypothetical protein